MSQNEKTRHSATVRHRQKQGGGSPLSNHHHHHPLMGCGVVVVEDYWAAVEAQKPATSKNRSRNFISIFGGR